MARNSHLHPICSAFRELGRGDILWWSHGKGTPWYFTPIISPLLPYTTFVRQQISKELSEHD